MWFKNRCKEINIFYLVINNEGIILNDNLNGININIIDKKYINAIISLHLWCSPKNTDDYKIHFYGILLNFTIKIV